MVEPEISHQGDLLYGDISMPRFHTITKSGLPGQIDIPFTPEEEALRDIEESSWQIQKDADDLLLSEQAKYKLSATSKLLALGLSQAEIDSLIVRDH